MSGRRRRGRLAACSVSSSSTATSRTSAASCSQPSRGTRARFAASVTLASCLSGGHEIWWTVEAATDEDALAHLPFYVAERTTTTRVSEVEIP